VAARVLSRVQSLDGEALERLALAPEMTSRVGRPASQVSILPFIEQSVRAELRRAGTSVDAGEPCLSALGDYSCDAAGGERRAETLRGGIPLDFDSPYAATVDVAGLDRNVCPARPVYEASERRRIVDRSDAALRAIAGIAPEAAWFVNRFTKVLIVQRNLEEPSEFTSGSNGLYIGRTFLANAHLASVTVERLADALVHEAVHALLYMDELETRWLTAGSGHDAYVRSPWSGRDLLLRQFLQACFVWYGLACFWSRAALVNVFDRREVLAFLRRTALGFHAPLADLLAPWEAIIAPELFAAATTMRSTIVDAAA
jgi:HEXXH motif-containing protein